MMMNLFSVFDPSSFYGISFNWMIMIIVFLMFPSKFYLIKSDSSNMFMKMMDIVSKMMKEVGSMNYLMVSFISISAFSYLMMSNLLSLFPFVFTSAAHPMITLGWGLVLWMTFFVMGYIKNFKESAAHLVPVGSPIMLSPLMVIIESVSHLIRPFTLSIRLAANMMAGHLIMGLLSSISMISIYSFFSSIILQNILLMLEFAVAIIQGFVFSILLMLYALEYY